MVISKHMNRELVSVEIAKFKFFEGYEKGRCVFQPEGVSASSNDFLLKDKY